MKYALKNEDGFLAIQGRETWHEKKPIGWVLTTDHPGELKRWAEYCKLNKGYKIVSIQTTGTA